MSPSPKEIGADFERRVANNLEKLGCGAMKVPYSGASKDFKGDVQCDIGGQCFLIECKKTRGRKNWTLEKSMLDKIKEQAAQEGR